MTTPILRKVKNEMVIHSDKYCVYCHENKLDGKKYIGQTKLGLYKRAGKNGYKYKGSRHFYYAIQKYGWDGFYHYEIASNLTLEEANHFEELLIKELKTNDSTYGYNIAFGGDNKEPTEETKAIWKKQRSKGTYNSLKVECDGRLFNSVTQCAKFYGIKREAMKNWLNRRNNMPIEFIEKGLKYYLEEKPYEPQRGFGMGNNPRSRRVVCNNKVFSCVKECSLFYNIPYTTMTHWLKNERPMPERFIEMNLGYYNA